MPYVEAGGGVMDTKPICPACDERGIGPDDPGDERVCGWVHQEDYGLYCFLADCPVDFDAALAAAEGEVTP